MTARTTTSGIRLVAFAALTALLSPLALAQAPPNMANDSRIVEIGNSSQTNAARQAVKKANDTMARAAWFTDPLESPKGLAKDKPPPIEALLGRPTLDLMAMSPDGKRIAAIRREDGKSHLLILDAQNPGVGGKVTNLGESVISLLEWANNDRLIYIMRAERPVYKADKNGIFMEGAPRIYGINADLTSPMMFFANEAKMSRANASLSFFKRIPGDSENILIPAAQQGTLDLLKVNVLTGAFTKIADGQPETADWFVDRDGTPGIRVDSNARGTELYFYTRTSKPGQPLSFREALRMPIDPGTNYQKFRPIAAAPQSGQYYVIARPDNADTLGVYIYDIGTNTYVKPLFSKPGFDVTDAFIDPRTGEYLGAFYWDDRLKFEFADAASGQLMAALDSYFEGNWNIRMLDYAPAVGRALVKVRNPTSAGEYHIVDVKAGAVNALGKVKPELDGLPLGNTRAIRYKARDGVQLLAYLTLPAGFKPGVKPPMVVMPHGGPEARDDNDFDPWVQFLASRGYMVLQPQFRGSAGFGDTFGRSGQAKWGTDMQYDLVDGVEFLASQNLADKNRICIFGASYGGYAALMGAMQYSNLYKCAISASGPSDLNRMLNWQANQDGGDSLSVKYWTSQMGSSSQRNEASPALHADKVAIPVLLLHGKEDNIVPVQQSEVMRDALKNARKDVQYVEFEYQGHGFSGRDGKRMLTLVEEFLGRHLGVPVIPTLPDPPMPKD